MPPPDQRPLGSPFSAATTAEDVMDGLDLSGTTAVVTGGYSGLGLETTRSLAAAGARVIVPARRPDTARTVLRGVDGCEVVAMDLADLGSVRAAAARIGDRIDRLDLLWPSRAPWPPRSGSSGPAGRASSPPTASGTSRSPASPTRSWPPRTARASWSKAPPGTP